MSEWGGGGGGGGGEKKKKKKTKQYREKHNYVVIFCIKGTVGIVKCKETSDSIISSCADFQTCTSSLQLSEYAALGPHCHPRFVSDSFL